MLQFGTIVKIILMLMKWADALFAYLHDQEKIKEGEDLAIANAAAAILVRSKRAAEINDAYAKLAMDEIKKEMDKQGEFRD